MIGYIPILTTTLSVVFLLLIVPHALRKPRAYLLWWAVGVLFYGLGTLVESLHTLQGWSPGLFRAWYIFGALLGGAPLAQGTVHLLMPARKAWALSIALIVAIVFSSVLVLLSPLATPGPEAKLSGAVLEWQGIRLITPFINIYAFIFLVGGAAWSAWQYARKGTHRARMNGNILIALGGLLPGIGGSFTKFGHVEVLYITELLGLILILIGYEVIRRAHAPSVHANQLEASPA
ncbi:MAG: hypothetical protein D6722_13860 [Bacteroidetes bacterium]|nr:MAG: hypothetical protein D6722_13860 [Bacteroidota bacterium]